MLRREFGARDLVLRKIVGNMRDINARKLAPTWEGPYSVTSIAGIGAYYLEDLDERPLPWPWNVHNLKKFYYYQLKRVTAKGSLVHVFCQLSTMFIHKCS